MTLFEELAEDITNDNKIVKTLKPKTELSNDIFVKKGNTYIMLDDIRKRLIEISDDFINSFGVEFFIHDIILTGSLANFNWSSYSDVDLHIILDMDEFGEENKNEILLRTIFKEFFNSKKVIWNNKREIKVKNFEVEVYVQDINEPHVSSGVYSIMNNEWLVTPTRKKPNIDDRKIVEKGDEIAKKIEEITSITDGKEAVEAINIYKTKLKKFRQCGLESGGEYSYENLTFKLLRRNGEIKKLMDFKNKVVNNKLSINESPDKVKNEEDFMLANWQSFDSIPFGIFGGEMLVGGTMSFMPDDLADKIDSNFLETNVSIYGYPTKSIFSRNEGSTHPEIPVFYKMLQSLGLETRTFNFRDNQSMNGFWRTMFEKAGRIWHEKKIIAFWDYPRDKNDLLKILGLINKELMRTYGRNVDFGEYQIEVKDKNGGYVLIPLKKYVKSGAHDKETLESPHLQTDKEKEQNPQMLATKAKNMERDAKLEKGWGSLANRNFILKKDIAEAILYETPDRVYSNDYDVKPGTLFAGPNKGEIANYKDNDAVAFGTFEGEMLLGVNMSLMPDIVKKQAKVKYIDPQQHLFHDNVKNIFTPEVGCIHPYMPAFYQILLEVGLETKEIDFQKGDEWKSFWRTDFGFSGRLWYDRKIIAFWEYPRSKGELYGILDKINIKMKRIYGKPLDFSDYRIEILTKEEIAPDWANDVKYEDAEYAIQPIVNYKDSKKVSDKTLKAPHLQTDKEKEQNPQMQATKAKNIERDAKLEKGWDSMAQRNFVLKKDIAEVVTNLNETPDSIGEFPNLAYYSKDAIPFGIYDGEGILGYNNNLFNSDLKDKILSHYSEVKKRSFTDKLFNKKQLSTQRRFLGRDYNNILSDYGATHGDMGPFYELLRNYGINEKDLGFYQKYMETGGFGRSEYEFSGRLWYESKVISFWEYPPNKEVLVNTLTKLNKTAQKIYNTEFDFMNYRLEINVDGDDNEIILIKDYISSEDVSKEKMEIPHLLPPEEKAKNPQMQAVKRKNIERDAKIEKHWDSMAQRNFILKKDIAEMVITESPDKMNYLDEYDIYNTFKSEDSLSFGFFKEEMIIGYNPSIIPNDLNSEIWKEYSGMEVLGKDVEETLRRETPTMHFENLVFYEVLRDLGVEQKDLGIVELWDENEKLPGREVQRLTGRLWMNDKVMSFWNFPSTFNELQSVLGSLNVKLQKIYNMTIDFNEYKIEVIFPNEGYAERLIPIPEFMNSLPQPEEKQKADHVLPSDEKIKTPQMASARKRDLERNAEQEKDWGSVAKRNFILNKDIAEMIKESEYYTDSEDIKNIYKKAGKPEVSTQKTPIVNNKPTVLTDRINILRALIYVSKNTYGDNNVTETANGFKIYDNDIVLTQKNDLIINGGKIPVKKFSSIKSGKDTIQYPYYNYIKYRIKKQVSTNQQQTPQSNSNKGYVDPLTLQPSIEFWSEIKTHEGLPGSGKPALVSYELGDGKRTIGWGHTGLVHGKEQIGKQTTITPQEASILLKNDVTKSIECVRRIFNSWKREDINSKPVLITQNMFDVLVSLVFNSGCSALNKSDLMKYIRASRFDEAGELIKNYRINSKFEKGLLARREKEADKFTRTA